MIDETSNTPDESPVDQGDTVEETADTATATAGEGDTGGAAAPPPPVDIPPDDSGGNKNAMWIAGAVVVALIILAVAWMAGRGDGSSEVPTVLPPTSAVEGVEPTALPTEEIVEPGEAPTAVITGPSQATVGESVAFDARRSSGESPIALYVWDFGDGTKATDAVVEHAYDLAGTFLVTLVVVDSEGQQGRSHTYISVSESPQTPPAAQITGPSESIAGESVMFDASGSKAGDGAIASYAWSLGNGQTGEGVTISTTYDKPGTYQVHLVVTDANGLSDSASHQIKVTELEAPTPAPPAAVIVAPSSASVGEQVLFDGRSSSSGNSIVGYLWEFDDGNKANAVQAMHAFDKAGTYKVSLTVKDSEGLIDIAAHDIKIEAVQDKPPTAAIAAPPAANVGEPVRFDGSSSTAGSSPISTYKWAFGNGQTASGAQASATYLVAGAYQAYLTVVDESGLSDGASHEILINAGLEGTQWLLENTLTGSMISIAFSSGAVSGSSGCNTYSGAYTVSGNQLTISELTTTQRICTAELLAQESAYLEALVAAQTYEVRGTRLTINTSATNLDYTSAR